MKVRRISATGFMRCDAAHLELPSTGLVLVTGLNGAGKSSIVEAVSYAVAGKTLRGTDPRRASEAGHITLVTDQLSVERRWSGNPPKVKLEVSGHDDFDTVSKAQDYISSLVNWDTWRRSCAFSSVDDMGFASATDTERKRLLESLLGLSRFDDALERVRTATKAAVQTSQVLSRRVLQLHTKMQADREGAERLKRLRVLDLPNLANLRARLESLREMLPEREAAAEEAAESTRVTTRENAIRDQQIRELEHQIKAVGGTHCPTCSRVWDDASDREAQLKHLADALERARDGHPIRGNVDHAFATQQALNQCRQSIASLESQVAVAETRWAQYESASAEIRAAELALLDLEDQHDDARHQLTKAQADLVHLEAAESALGTKGARAHLLTDALTTVEDVANDWLRRVERPGETLRLKLSPYTEKRTGGTSDAISLEVTGAGGGRGYKASSAGEQRRIDVALMLALADLAQRSANISAPTQFFDEVLDALDADGVERCQDVFTELAQDRCVVVISHNPEVVRHLSATMRIDVVNGNWEVS